MQRPPVFSTETSLTDLSQAANVDLAGAELDRALDRNDDRALIDWARRYGPHAVAALREATIDRFCPDCDGELEDAA